MAKNISILGASYSDVPAVVLPATGGGTATFFDISDTTAAANDVMDGKVFYTTNGTRSIGTNSGIVAPTIITVTQAQYDALSTYDNNTFYVVNKT